ncbi:hypothetical protein AVHY2522_24725 [Acidovorax sp. SUPP2522]|uniref:hypothetical protein n=1 Tax=unclassified Acidovorax TaxID=2684926 RepID=UPI00234BDA1D|nr:MULTISPECIES: hypothetical protein [unclassified Acidovorax]WCM98324.1 hypothetical protein M5C96_02325 [Acidovorax sp. GBBC 1281]GKT20075.1 hypothetical protein AVHY2522_24725 [Acidovorax sp. SUPP2522]
MNAKRCFLINGAVAVSTTLLIVTGCKGKEEAKPTVSIQKTSPSGETPLVAGDEINFQIDVRVQGLHNAAQVSLIVQSAEGVVVADCAPITVSNGVSVRLNAVGVVPETTVVRVFTPLYINGGNNTEVLDTRLFKVVGKRSK